MLNRIGIATVAVCAVLNVQAQNTNTDQTSSQNPPSMTTTTTTTTTSTMPAELKNMAPPAAMQNKVYDAMVGEWNGTSNMFGMQVRDHLKISWMLNHQFLKMELQGVGVGQPKVNYEGLGIFGLDGTGKAKTWWFDSWGADHVSTGTGEFGDNMLTLTDSNPMFNETRTFEIKGNQMTMHAKGTMTINGKDIPFDQTTVYTKK